MAVRFAAVSLAGVVSESDNAQDNLALAVSDAIDTADAAVDAVGTANAEAGSNADVTTEVAAAVSAVADVATALTALTAGLPGTPVFVSVDTASVTTKDKLRQLLDAAYDHFVSTNYMT